MIPLNFRKWDMGDSMDQSLDRPGDYFPLIGLASAKPSAEFPSLYELEAGLVGFALACPSGIGIAHRHYCYFSENQGEWITEPGSSQNEAHLLQSPPLRFEECGYTGQVVNGSWQ